MVMKRRVNIVGIEKTNRAHFVQSKTAKHRGISSAHSRAIRST